MPWMQMCIRDSLCDFPAVKEEWIDEKLEADMDEVLDTVVMGRAARNTANIIAGNPRWARVVGYALHVNPDPAHIPCYRVVNREGDVYKRQLWRRRSRNRRKRISMRRSSARRQNFTSVRRTRRRDSSRPVSYTHLDLRELCCAV